MADTAAKTTKAAKATAKAAKEDAETLGARLTDGTREFVKRSTETAKERTENMYDASKRYNEGLEDVLVRAAKGYTDVLGNLADAAYANVNHTFAAAEKMAEAKSISEAAQIQADYVREQATANMENVR